MLTDSSLATAPDSQLDAQFSQLLSAVRKSPSDMRLRIHLAQAAMQLGQWERALGQLQTLGIADPAHLPFAQTYREAIRCERVRERIFAGELAPPVLGEPPAWIAQLAQALKLRAAHEHSAADALLADALEHAPATRVSLDGIETAWLSDGDSRLGPIFEMFLNGHYYWVPIHDVQRLQLERPVDLRDLVWLPAQVTLTNGGQHPVLMPVRYPGSCESGSDALRCARETHWLELGSDSYAGLGQRMWASDSGEHSMLDTRVIEQTGDAGMDSETALNG